MKKLFRNKITYITLSFYTGFLFLPLFISAVPDFRNILSMLTSFTLPNYLILLCPVLLTIILTKKANEKDTSVLLTFTYAVLLPLTFFEFIKGGTTLFFVTVAVLLLSAVCINAGQPFASLVLIPGLFLRSFGTGYIFMCYIPVMLMLVMKLSRAEREEKKSLMFTVGAYLYTVIFAGILFARNNLRISFSPVEFYPTPTEKAKLIAGILLVTAACVSFIIRTLPLMKNGSVLFRLSTVLFSLFPLAGCITGLLTGIISSHFPVVFLVTTLIYITGNINISLSDKSAPPVLPEKHSHILLGICGAAMCILVF